VDHLGAYVAARIHDKHLLVLLVLLLLAPSTQGGT
jgi:hypothetical protein